MVSQKRAMILEELNASNSHEGDTANKLYIDYDSVASANWNTG
jgi:hypothetical protein